MESSLKLVQSEAFYMEELEGEWLLYKPTSQKALYLDQSASVIWQLCDGTRSAEKVAEEIAQLYPGNEENVSNDVLATLEMLHIEGALLALETD